MQEMNRAVLCCQLNLWYGLQLKQFGWHNKAATGMSAVLCGHPHSVCKLDQDLQCLLHVDVATAAGKVKVQQL